MAVVCDFTFFTGRQTVLKLFALSFYTNFLFFLILAEFFKYKKYGENSVIISTAAFEPGEYCLAITNMMTNTKSAKVYTFRVK